MGTRRTGFTLVEVMVVLGVVAMLAVIAFPAYAAARERSRNVRFASDLRVAAHAFDYYATANGAYPPDKTPGVIPVGMAEYLTKIDWAGQTAIGGRWDWDYLQLQFGCRAGISVYQPTWSAAQMVKVDALIDDGNLATGEFRARSQGYIYILEH